MIVLNEENSLLFRDFRIEKSISQRESWALLHVVCNLNQKEQLKNIDSRLQAISNILVSIGTTFWIVLFGLIIGIFYIHCDAKQLLYLGGNFFVLVILFCNYQLVATIHQSLHERTIEWMRKNISNI